MGKGKATAGLVLGIVGIVFAVLNGYFALLGLPIAIVGLVLSVVGGKALKADNQPSGIATAGLVIGIIAVVFTAIAFVSCGLCVLCAAGVEEGLENALQ
ncbi:MAG: hypothetical protein E7550_04690 [Ruminococcaceae bacterium]|nr:hypothetical protein [Oscillospiraceae bacterium]